MNKEFNGKKVVITGGCKGIGKSIAELFLEEGANVVVTYCNSEKAAEAMKENCVRYQERLSIYKMDVSKAEVVYKVMAEIQEKLGGIDILINNAGIIKDSLVYSMNEMEWDQVLRTNLYGTFYTIKSVLYNMIKQREGNIINIASISGLTGILGQANYCASKFGVIGLTKTLAKELGKKNIRVNAVAPGYVDMIKGVKNINGKITSPKDIAYVVKFLASKESKCINGQVIVADDGNI
jgi:3-oxoacyl-[acyl-carrier protein] reductase